MINKVLLFPYTLLVYEKGGISLYGMVVLKNGKMNNKMRCCWFEMVHKSVMGEL